MFNSFQEWATEYVKQFGFTATIKGNWVELHKDGETIECMSYQGVLDAVRS